jgi:amino acid permease
LLIRRKDLRAALQRMVADERERPDTAFEDLLDDILTKLCDRIREKTVNEKLRRIVFPIPIFLLNYVYAIIAFGAVMIVLSTACLTVLIMLLRSRPRP